MAARILLFDLDGVLLKPGGYRSAVRAAMDYFLRQMRMEYANLTENDMALFESMGVTSEWDMIPISLAIALNAVLVNFPGAPQLTSLSSAIQWANQSGRSNDQVLYLEQLPRLKAILQNGIAPSQALLDAVRKRQSKGLLTSLAEQPFLDELLGTTRSVDHSPVTRIFQNIVLGNDTFTQTYGLTPEIICRSVLQEHDVPLLDMDHYRLICRLQGAGEINSAILTARPSLPPLGVPANHGYSPEAELALDLLGLNDLPMIGYGRLVYLAGQLGIEAESLLKPAPAQALAAIAAAWSHQELASLTWAGQIQTGLPRSEPSSSIDLPHKLELHIFEDTPIGILAARRAAEILADFGKQVSFHAWGIATNPNKTAALQACGAAVFSNVNLAIEKALK